MKKLEFIENAILKMIGTSAFLELPEEEVDQATDKIIKVAESTANKFYGGYIIIEEINLFMLQAKLENINIAIQRLEAEHKGDNDYGTIIAQIEAIKKSVQEAGKIANHNSVSIEDLEL